MIRRWQKLLKGPPQLLGEIKLIDWLISSLSQTWLCRDVISYRYRDRIALLGEEIMIYQALYILVVFCTLCSGYLPITTHLTHLSKSNNHLSSGTLKALSKRDETSKDCRLSALQCIGTRTSVNADYNDSLTNRNRGLNPSQIPLHRLLQKWMVRITYCPIICDADDQ